MGTCSLDAAFLNLKIAKFYHYQHVTLSKTSRYMILFQQRGRSMTWFTLVKLIVRKEKSQIQQNPLEYSPKIILVYT